MANTRTANTTASVFLKTAFLKSVLFRLILLLGIAALPSFAFAVDTDGDGVDDSVDAFPNNAEASVDTDGDGKPDWLVQVVEGFEYGTGYALASPWTTSFNVNRSTNQNHSGSWGAAIGSSGVLCATLRTSSSFSYWGKNSAQVTVDGVVYSVAHSFSWQKYTIQTSPGLHLIEFLTCSGGLCFGTSIDDVSYNPESTLIEDLNDDNDSVADTGDAFPLDNTQAGDIDTDGIDGFVDNCPANANADQLNTDGDTLGNVCDTDDDNDGVADTSDAFPLDNTKAGDTDGDGVDKLVDNCPSNANADQLNTDGDTKGNVCDGDDDNDGVADTSDKFPLNVAASSDTDVDGFPGSWNAACDAACQASSGLLLDNCPSNANADQLNTDGDTKGNVCDPDDDNDGMPDVNDAFPLNAAETLDTDHDSIGNNADSDDDNDGLPDVMDPLPLQAKFNLNAPYKGSQLGDQNAVQ